MGSDRKSFWKTLPGIVAAIAGFLSAIAGILAAVHELGWIQGIESPSTTSSAVVQDTTASTASNSNALFEDRFSDISGGWTRQNPVSAGGVADYVGDNYRLSVPTKLAYAVGPNWLPSPSDQREVGVETNASNNTGDAEWSSMWGVFCRRDSKGERSINAYYFLGVTGDGRGVIGKHYASGSAERLATSEPAEVIAPGVQTNRIRAECVGSTLTLYVNGQELLHTQDEEYEYGSVGLVVLGGNNKGADVTFANFAVTRP